MSVSFQRGNGTIGVGLDEAEMQGVRDALAAIEGGAELAARSAINDTLRYARTQLVRLMGEHLNLKAAEIRDRIQVKQQATAQTLEGILRIDYRPVPLEDFKARFRRKSGVWVTTVKSEGVQTFKHMFRAQMLSGHTGVFERVRGAAKVVPTGGRYAAGAMVKRSYKTADGRRAYSFGTRAKAVLRQPIRETFGPSVLRAFDLAPGLADAALADIGAKLQERLLSKVQWQLDKARPDAP